MPQNWKEPWYPLGREWIIKYKYLYIHTMEYHLVIKKIQIHTTV